jgi:hypothetical protein
MKQCNALFVPFRLGKDLNCYGTFHDRGTRRHKETSPLIEYERGCSSTSDLASGVCYNHKPSQACALHSSIAVYFAESYHLCLLDASLSWLLEIQTEKATNIRTRTNVSSAIMAEING